jgi:hypothetical protein
MFCEDGVIPYFDRGLSFILHPELDLVVQAEDLTAAMRVTGFREFDIRKVWQKWNEMIIENVQYWLCSEVILQQSMITSFFCSMK